MSAPSPADAALEDGRHFGYVRSVDPGAGTIEFDLAYYLSGKEADQAYQEATGDTGHVPNDHFVVNDNPLLRTLTLAPDARLRLLDWNHCCETFFDGDLSLFAQAIEQQSDVADGDLIYRGQSQWWVTVENGVVTRDRGAVLAVALGGTLTGSRRGRSRRRCSPRTRPGARPRSGVRSTAPSACRTSSPRGSASCW